MKFKEDGNHKNHFISHKQQSPEVFVYEKRFTPIVRLYLFINIYCDLFVRNKMRLCVFLRAYNKILKRSRVQRVMYARIVLPRGGGNVTGGIGNESFFSLRPMNFPPNGARVPGRITRNRVLLV